MNTPKVAIVTGVSSGLGLESALLLADTRHIVGISRHVPDDPRWLRLQNEDKVSHIVGDVADEETVKKAFTYCESIGQLDVVMNCAGAGVFGPAGQFTRKDIDTVIKGNLIGTIQFSEAAFSRFKALGGVIINVMSTAAHVGRANEAIYCASKWGARGYTESLRLEAKGTKVKVIGVYPGGMNTPFWKNAQGSTVDGSKFMNSTEVAQIIYDAIKSYSSSYVSDIIINRV